MAYFKTWRDRRRNSWKGVFYDARRLWKGQRGHALLYDYMNLPEGAVVFDFGGHKGDWADMVLNQQPDSTIHLFEPHPGFAAGLRDKYRAEDRVKVYDYALGPDDGKLTLPDEKTAPLVGADHDKGITADLVAVARFFDTFDIPRIDLMKMNIHGGEYDLLPALVDTGVMGRIGRLQVQFHLFSEEMIDMREAIRAELEDTHDCTWCYPFVWEEWQLRG